MLTLLHGQTSKTVTQSRDDMYFILPARLNLLGDVTDEAGNSTTFDIWSEPIKQNTSKLFQTDEYIYDSYDDFDSDTNLSGYSYYLGNNRTGSGWNPGSC